jgi:hypothetical protein
LAYRAIADKVGAHIDRVLGLGNTMPRILVQ